MSGKDDNHSILKAVGTASTIGFQLVSAVIVGIAAGRWFDHTFATAPWATVAGIVLGMGAGLWSIYKKIMAK